MWPWKYFFSFHSKREMCVYYCVITFICNIYFMIITLLFTYIHDMCVPNMAKRCFFWLFVCCVYLVNCKKDSLKYWSNKKKMCVWSRRILTNFKVDLRLCQFLNYYYFFHDDCFDDDEMLKLMCQWWFFLMINVNRCNHSVML